jgi:two-component system, cell cycle sensor histidine kinase and response regulator CckA
MSNPRRTHLTERDLVNRARDVTYAYDLGGNLTFLSEEGERISGYSREEACRMNIAELLDSDIAAQAREQIERDLKERIGTVYEIDLIAKDGRRVALEVSAHVVSRNGVPVEVQGLAVPSVIRSQIPPGFGARCLDENFSFSKSLATSDLIVRIS